jgi:hypothetical protein
MQHVVIYREAGRYAGWPANYGIWSWGEEVVVGYIVGHYQHNDTFHARDKNQPFLTYQSRSLDGGRSWDVQPFAGKSPGGRGLSADEHMNEELWVANHLDGPEGLQPSPGGIDFSHPDFALMCARTNLHAGARSWFYISYDRCRQWQGPYDLPTAQLLPSGEPGIAARTDYLIDSRDTCTLFLTAVKSNGREGSIFCAHSEDGGKHFNFLAWVTPEPQGHAIMPAALRLSPTRILCAVRCSGPRTGAERPPCWIDLYASNDNGATWHFFNRPVPNTGLGGNPPTLTQLHDGRLLMTYGLRHAPYAILAMLSEDSGATWGAPITLRERAGNHDIGYPRTTQLVDGRVVTAYYWNDRADGERYIAVTLWRP